MKIQVLTDNLVVPGLPAFFTGQTYEVDAQLANQLIERMQAVEAKEKEESTPERKGKRQNTN